jgi:hypothetical protein
MKKVTGIRILATGVTLAALAACGGGSPPPPPPPTYTIGGTISGLTGGGTVTLNDPSAGSSGAIGNGAFTLPTALDSGATYAVTATASTGETCTVTNGSGTVGSANVTNILVACAATVVPTYTIGGTVSGLSGGGTVTLSSAGAGSSGAIGNGAFTLPTALDSGVAYAVTATASTGETCTVTNGSGTVGSAKVTNIVVACTSSGTGTGGGVGFWMPFSAAPVSGTSGGKTGLFLIPSNSIAASPAPQPAFVTTNPPTILGLAFQGGQFSSPPTTALIPALMMYAAEGADGNTHVYGLDLANPSNSSTVPTPTQITNLSIPASKNICSGGEIETNAATPTTMQIVVYVVTPEAGALPGTNGYCSGVTGGTYYVINYTDSPTAAPTVTTIPGGSASYPALFNDGNFAPLNLSTGVLGGLLLWDAATTDENFYTSAAFTSSTTLISGVTGIPVACVNVTGVTNGNHDSLGGSYLANVSTASGIAAYQFTASGAANQFFAGDTAACITDSTNLYFLGTPTGGSTQAIYEEPVTALSSPKTLLGGLTLATETDDYTIIGSNGSVLVFDNFTVSGSGNVSTSVMSVPVGVTSTSATTIGGPYAGAFISDFLATPGSGSASGDLLFLTESNSTTSDNVTTVTFASQVLDPNGAGSTISTSPNAVWQSFGVFTTELSGYVLQITGITDTTGGYGGAKLNLYDTASLSAAPVALTTSGGAAYTVPANTVLSVSGISGTTVAEAVFFSETTGNSFGAAVDVSKHAILPLTFTNTNVTPVL